MTEAEWLACDDPELLLGFWVRKKDRKLRLATVADGVTRAREDTYGILWPEKTSR